MNNIISTIQYLPIIFLSCSFSLAICSLPLEQQVIINGILLRFSKKFVKFRRETAGRS